MESILRSSAAAYPDIEFLEPAKGVREFFRVLECQRVDVAIIGTESHHLPPGYETIAERYGQIRVLGINAGGVDITSFERCFVARPWPGEPSAEQMMRHIIKARRRE